MQTTVLNTFGPGSVMYRFVLSYADLTSAASTQQITLLALAKGTIIKGVRIKHGTLFSGGGLTTMTLSVDSSTGGVGLFASAFDIHQAVADTTMEMVSGWKAGTYAADTLMCTFTCSGNVNIATAGIVTIDVEMWQEPDLTGCGPFGTAGTAGAPTTPSL